LYGEEVGSLLSPATLPKIETEAASRNYGRFVITPLQGGFGITLGNALRRVLLSSLPGAAVTSLKVSDVYHEFSEIPHIKEDMMTLLLNAKQLRLRLLEGESAKLRVQVKGEGSITAADLDVPANVEIINPDLHLLTADSDEAELEIEFTVGAGVGYSPAEDRGERPSGETPVAAIVSPLRKAVIVVERTRIQQLTNFDKLVLEVTTDGTIRPADALRQSAQMLVQHFALIAGVSAAPEGVAEKVAEIGAPEWVRETPIEELELTVRAYNCLKRAGITQVGEILDRFEKGEDEMLAIRNFGRKSLDELMEKMRAKGFIPAAESAPAE
jgi:DNA-directed RNA polymerase subunit alpha